jgi:sarcosine oxidase, subunit gamma
MTHKESARMSELKSTYALSHRHQDSESQSLLIDMRERVDVGMIDLRGKVDDKTFMKNVTAVLGVELPIAPRTCSKKGEITVLWLSIDQWLITLPLKSRDALLLKLTKKLGRNLSLVCDVSDARTIIRLTGDLSREVLIKGCSFDATMPEFAPGTVRRLLFAEVAALCHFVDGNPDIVDLYVFRSYANYVWEWLLQTAHGDTQLGLFQAQDMPLV